MSNAAPDHELDDATWARALTHELASALVGQPLEFLYADMQGQTQAATLLVQSLSERADYGSTRQFSLMLLGPAGFRLPQRTYRARHAELGDFAIFITPVAAKTEGIEYEVCVSHER